MDSTKRSKKSTFSTAEASHLAKLSPYMVDYLCRQKLVVPNGMGTSRSTRGKSRRYKFSDILLMRCYSMLLEKGVSVKRIRQAYKSWKNYFADSTGKEFYQEFLITDGTTIAIKTKDDLIRDLNSEGQLIFSFIIDLQSVSDDVKSKL